MNVHHHLDDTTLLRYASGDLDEAFLVVAAAHLAMCDHCRHAAHMAEEVGGELLETSDQAVLGADAFERVMQRIDSGEERITAKRQGTRARTGDVPLPLQRFVGNSLDAIRWKSVAPGVRKHDIKLSGPSTSSLYMLHIAPGKALPEHGHGGTEMTLVLSGAYRDEL
ncbi:MAG: transcriptional regulator, partial [Burkholderiales bacterium]|nr:transcriptional regulator [Burkholderiales bacterium]